MTREEIIKLAQECQLIGMRPHLDGIYQESLERFAALVAAYVRETEFKPDWNKYQQGLADGAAAEREEIAQFLESTNLSQLPDATALHYARLLKGFAEGIRARKENT